MKSSHCKLRLFAENSQQFEQLITVTGLRNNSNNDILLVDAMSLLRWPVQVHSFDVQLENVHVVRLEAQQLADRWPCPSEVAVHELLDVRPGLCFESKIEQILHVDRCSSVSLGLRSEKLAHNFSLRLSAKVCKFTFAHTLRRNAYRPVAMSSAQRCSACGPAAVVA